MNRLGLVLSLMPVSAGLADAAPPVRSAQPPSAWKQPFERLGVRDARVLAAVDAVPREAFLEPEQRRFAWEDRPLPIGYGQTTSQPSLIAFTLQAAKPGPSCRALEVGTGCGYQTALLSNTNALHIAEINRRLAAQYGLQHGIADCLNRVFYSQEVGLRKPGEEIFRHALREMNWRAEDVLFIEDSPQHVATVTTEETRDLHRAQVLQVLREIGQQRICFVINQ